MHLITLDWECYLDSEYTLEKLTTFDYVVDPRFQTIGVSVKIDDDVSWWLEDSQFREFAKTIDWSQVAVLAQHTHFESLIMREHYGIEGVGLWLDTLSMDRALRQTEPHGLGDIAMHWCGRPKMEFPKNEVSGVRREDMAKRTWERYGDYSCNDNDITHDSFVNMMKVFPEAELAEIDIIIRMYCEPKLVIDRSILVPYARRERLRRSDFLQKLDIPHEIIGTDKKIAKMWAAGQQGRAMKKILGSSDKFAALLRANGIEPTTKVTPSKKGWTYAFAKTDPFMQGLVESPDEEIATLAQARLDTKSTLNITRPLRFLRLGRRGRPAPVYLVPYAAHTFRLGGGDAANWQNLENVKPGKPDSGSIRKSIAAPVGYRIVGADSGQIEARKVAYLARSPLLADFRAGVDVYSKAASVLFRRPVDRKKKVIVDGVETIPDFLEGQIGKIQILGFGYGMGWAKLAPELMRGMLGAPPIQFTMADVRNLDVDFDRFSRQEWNINKIQEIPTRRSFNEMLIHCAVSHHIVMDWRGKNPEVADKHDGLWAYGTEVIKMMARGHRQLVFRDTCETKKGGLILPNGLIMQYDSLHWDEAKKNWVYYAGLADGWKTLYGGKIIENVVQALCKILVAKQMVKYHGLGYNVAFFTHDELASVVEELRAAGALAHMLEIMKQPEPWCRELPLHADGYIATHYEA